MNKIKDMQRSVLAFILALSFFHDVESGEWAEATLNNMTLEEKIGQLFVVPVCPLRNDIRHEQDVSTALEKYRIGGIIIKQGTLHQQYHTIRAVQSKSSVPLFVVIDAEWGLSMRASDAQRFPRNMALGALSDTSLIEQMGREIGCQIHALGAHMNLAPVVDVNSNPLNPIIRMRSFGDDPTQVAKRATLFARGLRSAGVLACAKHFPGHGDTAIDSHRALPTITRTLHELQSVELPPFQTVIDDGIDAVMSGHIIVPAIDVLPASLSHLCMTKLLREKMGFRGLLITDALNMQGLTKIFSDEEVAKLAFKAGHNFLLYGDHIAPNVDAILEKQLPMACVSLARAVLSGEITEDELNNRVRQILETKERLGLHFERSPPNYTASSFHNKKSETLAEKIYQGVLTTIQDPNNYLPLASHAINIDDQGREFAARLQKRGVVIQPDASLVLMTIPDTRTEQEHVQIQDRLKRYAEQGKEVIAIVFGSPYSLPWIRPWVATCVLAYEDCEDAWEAAADFCTHKQ